MQSCDGGKVHYSHDRSPEVTFRHTCADLEAAIAGEADYIVSGDRDLTDMEEYAGIPVVRPSLFLEQMPK